MSTAQTRVIHISRATGGPDEQYIGRAGKGHDGYFGNPVAIGRKCPVCASMHQDRGSTLPCYRKHLAERMKNDLVFAGRVASLRGKTLVCFCKPQPCHGDILASVADGRETL